MKIAFATETVDLVQGDCIEVMREMSEASVDSVVCDPPYELGFMGKTWDASGIAYNVDLWREVLRVLKPGGHLLAFGGTRTYHRMTCAIEDAGFEVRDSLMWLHGQGFPKSLNGPWGGTALKPAHEPIVLARKPLVGTVAATVAAHGTGGLNVDGCRVATTDDIRNHGRAPTQNGWDVRFSGGQVAEKRPGQELGRWPANVLLDESAAAALDAQSGTLRAGVAVQRNGGGQRIFGGGGAFGGARGLTRPDAGYGDTGGASRFFYVAKPSRAERDLGCDHLPPKTGGEATDREDGSAGTENPRAGAGRTGGARNFHPTVKPIALMRWLVRLVTPPGGVVLDPFLGSGTTGIAALQEGFGFVGIEQSEEYMQIAIARVRAGACEADSK